MLIPSQIIITYVRPSYWLPGLEIGWGFVTGLIAFSQNAEQIYALRVLLGLFESSAWPGMMTLFSRFPATTVQRPANLGSVLVYAHGACQKNGLLPFMPSYRVHAVWRFASGNPGNAGRETWSEGMAVRVLVIFEIHADPFRWLFVINGVMTLTVGAAGVFMLPDYPNRPNPRAFWLSDEHIGMANNRLNRHGRSDAKRITWKSAKSVPF